jgi:metallo-beta-lactamase class B
MRITFISILLLSFNPVFSQQPEPNLKITHLTGSFYMYATYSLYEGNRIPAYSMYLVTDDGVALFDSPWDSTQFQPLLDSIKARHQKNVVLCIATHFHDDRTGGLEYYRQQGIKTYTTVLTDELSKQRGKKRAEYLIAKDTVFRLGHSTFQTIYPGPGHAPDNIVIWFKNEKILYGACLIKSVEDETLGYLGDANVQLYAASLKKVKQKCKNPRYIITGHSELTDTNSLNHSLQMAVELKKKTNRQ